MHQPHAVVVLVWIQHDRSKSGHVRQEFTRKWWLAINKGIAQDHKYASVKKPDNSRAILDMRYIAQPVRTDEIPPSKQSILKHVVNTPST